jgi:hypothetical protein
MATDAGKQARNLERQVTVIASTKKVYLEVLTEFIVILKRNQIYLVTKWSCVASNLHSCAHLHIVLSRNNATLQMWILMNLTDGRGARGLRQALRRVARSVWGVAMSNLTSDGVVQTALDVWDSAVEGED